MEKRKTIKKTMKKAKRATIAELEAILDQDEEVELEILPNGEVRMKGSSTGSKKPLTMRESLGGEYGIAA